MWSYGFKLAAAGILLLIVGIVAILIFSNIWARVGIGAALVIVCGGLLLFAWNVERKEKADRAGIDELQRI